MTRDPEPTSGDPAPVQPVMFIVIVLYVESDRKVTLLRGTARSYSAKEARRRDSTPVTHVSDT